MSLLSDAESDSEFRLTINEHYAKAFQYKKEREELEQLKNKYGSDAEEDQDSETDSEEDESEDEEGEELTPAVDAAILRTLARIKRKDPEIYNSRTGIFAEEQQKLGPTKPIVRQPKDKSRPVTMRQVALVSQLQIDSRTPSPEPVTHVEEQRRLRDETIAAFHQIGDDDIDGDDLLVPREKTKDEQEKEEEEYRAFLEREVGGDLKDLVTVEESQWQDAPSPSAEGNKKKQKKGKRPSKAEEDPQEFLMNYILNRGWIDRTSKHLPTYKEITSLRGNGKAIEGEGDVVEEAEGSNSPEILPTADPEVDEDDFEEIVDRFESSYNFRFEEPDAAVIQTHPRNIPSLVRREDTTRKEARERRKKRQEEEMQKRREEVKRLKALKMNDLRAKLDRIGREGGKTMHDDPALRDLDLEGEWDPEAHDRQMEGLYGDNADYDDDGKPTWDDDIDIGDIVMDDEDPSTAKKQKKKKKKKGKDKDEADDDGVDLNAMDADVDMDGDLEEWDGSEEMRKRKVEEYMDEIYGLDFNDMVGGMPTRFQYARVEPQTYHLTPAEILMATDAELNEFMSIKKFAPYRKDGKWDSNRGDRLKELKTKISERGYGGDPSQAEKPSKKRKGKNERMKMKVDAAGEDSRAMASPVVSGKGESLKRRQPEDDGSPDDSIEGLPEKKRRRHKKKNRDSTDT